MKNSVLILPFLLIVFGCTNLETAHVEISEQEQIVNSFDNLIKSDLEDDNIHGSVSFVIVKGNEVLRSEAYGFSNRDSKTAADTNTIFRIGSITKSFTGFLLVKLVQDGVLKLDDPIEDYLPEIASLNGYSEMSPITFRQLASHTSGIDRESRYREGNFGSLQEWEEKVLNSIPETSFRSKPGERFGYSNIGYAILGLAISRAADISYIDLVKTNILIPLNMDNTYFSIPNEKLKNLAIGMAGGPTAELDFELPNREHQGRGYRVPNGAIYSTANDLAKFMMANLGYSDILNKESIALLQATQTPTDRMRANYSFGFDLYTDEWINTVGHRGSTPGYTAHLEYEKNSEYGVVLLRNYNFGNTNFDLRANALLRKLSLAK